MVGHKPCLFDLGQWIATWSYIDFIHVQCDQKPTEMSMSHHNLYLHLYALLEACVINTHPFITTHDLEKP